MSPRCLCRFVAHSVKGGAKIVGAAQLAEFSTALDERCKELIAEGQINFQDDMCGVPPRAYCPNPISPFFLAFLPFL